MDSISFSLWMGLVILLFAIFLPLLFILGVTLRRRYDTTKNRMEVKGRIVKLEHVKKSIDFQSGNSNPQDYYHVMYVFIDGKGNTHLRHFNTDRFPHREGDAITVYYDPENPESCVSLPELRVGRAMPKDIIVTVMIFTAVCAALFLTAIILLK